MSIKVSKNTAFYFISAVVVVTNQFSGIILNQYIKYVVAALWTAYYMVLISKTNKSPRKSAASVHLRFMILPFLAFAIYTVFVWGFTGSAGLRNYTRLISTVLYMFLAYGFACAGFTLFGKKTIHIIFDASCFSYLIGSIIPLFLNFSATDILIFLRGTITGENSAATRYMEVHDLTFAIGLFFIYFLCVEDSKEKNHKLRIILSILLIFLGYKRIEILAIGAVIVAYILVVKKSKKISTPSTFFTIIFLVASFAYIFIIKDGTLIRLAQVYGIDFKNRLSFYSYANSYYELTPLYFGKGYTFFSKYWQDLYFSGFRIGGYGIAASIHSDILSNYIELGFIMFTIWILYSFKYKTVQFHRRYGIFVSEIYMLLTMYMFVLYFTDNTSTYFISQMVYCLIPLAATEITKSKISSRFASHLNEG